MNGRATTPPTIGSRLSQILERRGWSLGRLHRETVLLGDPVSLSQLSLLVRDRIEQPYPVTVRRICAALRLPTSALLGVETSTEEITDAGGAHRAGTILVHVVRISLDGGTVDTGERVGVAAELFAGRAQLLAAIVESGGMGPHILVGDTVVYDPDEVPRHRKVALLLHHGATICAWYVVRESGEHFQLADGSRLRADQVRVVGTVVTIQRPPPDFLD